MAGSGSEMDGTKDGSGFDAAALAKTLLRTVRAGTLATLDRSSGAPFASLVSVATDMDGAPILLVSGLSSHTANLDVDPRVSLLLAPGGKGDPLAHPRLTLGGRVVAAPEARIRRRFLDRHPKASLYADFPDFSFRRLEIGAVHLNGGFARAASLSPGELLTDLAGAEALLAGAEGALDHMNADHADAIWLYATRLARAPDGPWKAVGIDPDGIDLGAGDLTARMPFPERATDPGTLRRILVGLAAAARIGT